MLLNIEKKFYYVFYDEIELNHVIFFDDKEIKDFKSGSRHHLVLLSKKIKLFNFILFYFFFFRKW
jgi:hypothetical protein